MASAHSEPSRNTDRSISSQSDGLSVFPSKGVGMTGLNAGSEGDGSDGCGCRAGVRGPGRRIGRRVQVVGPDRQTVTVRMQRCQNVDPLKHKLHCWRALLKYYSRA